MAEENPPKLDYAAARSDAAVDRAVVGYFAWSLFGPGAVVFGIMVGVVGRSELAGGVCLLLAPFVCLSGLLGNVTIWRQHRRRLSLAGVIVSAINLTVVVGFLIYFFVVILRPAR